MTTTTLGPIVAAAVTALVMWLIAARRFSGRIGSSESKELWEESRSIRDWSSTRIETQNQRMVALETRLAQLEHSNTELARENLGLMKEIGRLEGVISTCTAEVESLTDRLRKSQERVVELEEEPDVGRDA